MPLIQRAVYFVILLSTVLLKSDSLIIDANQPSFEIPDESGIRTGGDTRPPLFMLSMPLQLHFSKDSCFRSDGKMQCCWSQSRCGRSMTLRSAYSIRFHMQSSVIIPTTRFSLCLSSTIAVQSRCISDIRKGTPSTRHFLVPCIFIARLLRQLRFWGFLFLDLGI